MAAWGQLSVSEYAASASARDDVKGKFVPKAVNLSNSHKIEMKISIVHVQKNKQKKKMK